jgi:hypothetical protein
VTVETRELGPLGVTAQAALELVLTGHPGLKAVIEPLIVSAKASDSELVFGRKVLEGVAAGQTTTVAANGKSDNSVEEPAAPKGDGRSTTVTSEVYSSRAAAMTPAAR